MNEKKTARMKKRNYNEKRNYTAHSRQHARIDLQVPRETWKRVSLFCSPGFQRRRHQEDCSEVIEIGSNNQSIKIVCPVLKDLSRCKRTLNSTYVNLDISIEQYPNKALFQ